ncbi:MAG: hypothetical protein WDM87_13655 [Terracidiphilus sp.]
MNYRSSYNHSMLFESFPVGPLACNCTILGDEETREAIVIDPGDDVRPHPQAPHRAGPQAQADPGDARPH